MEESSERLVRLGQQETLELPLIGFREITTVNDVEIQPINSIVVGGLFKIWSCDDFLLSYRSIRTFDQMSESSTTTEADLFYCFARSPQRCSSDFFFFRPRAEEKLKEESQPPRPALPKARPRRDPPPRVSRRSSQVSPPIYLRHRFQPQSRKDSSTRRQR